MPWTIEYFTYAFTEPRLREVNLGFVRGSADPHSYYDFGCRKPEEFPCTICHKQPPSLKSSASEIMFRLIFNIEKFHLDRDTTYDQYMYVARHKVPIERLVLFKEFPKVLKMKYTEFDDSSLGLIHRHCIDVVNSEISLISMERQISSTEEFVRLVTRYKTGFCCAHNNNNNNNLDWGPVPHFCPVEALQQVWLTPEVCCSIPVFLIVPTRAPRCLSRPQPALVP
jgi:hypothetical protein